MLSSKCWLIGDWSIEVIHKSNGMAGTVDKLAICKMYTRKNAQVVTDLQTSCNKVVVQIDIRMYSHCKSGTSCYHVVTRLMTVIDLQQVVTTLLQG